MKADADRPLQGALVTLRGSRVFWSIWRGALAARGRSQGGARGSAPWWIGDRGCCKLGCRHRLERWRGARWACRCASRQFALLLGAQCLVGFPCRALFFGGNLGGFAKIEASLGSLLGAQRGPLTHATVQFGLLGGCHGAEILGDSQPLSLLGFIDAVPVRGQRLERLLLRCAQFVPRFGRRHRRCGRWREGAGRCGACGRQGTTGRQILAGSRCSGRRKTWQRRRRCLLDEYGRGSSFGSRLGPAQSMPPRH
jgi:hypothetical protein